MQTTSQSKPSDRLIRLPEAEEKTGLKKSSIYAGMRAATFPKSIAITPHCVAWPQTHIDGWISRVIADSQAAA